LDIAPHTSTRLEKILASKPKKTPLTSAEEASGAEETN